MAQRIAAWRASAAALASRIYPGLDEALWNRQRDRVVRSAAPLPPLPARAAPPADAGPRLVLVATHDGPDAATWRPGAGNHFFEIAQTAGDLIGHDRVHVLRAMPGEHVDTWQARVVREVAEQGATHVLVNIETDPFELDDWNWDVFVRRLRAAWTGTLMGLMYDSAFEWTIIRARRLARLDPRMLVVALDRPIDTLVPPTQRHVGPVLLPISRASQAAVAEATAGVAKDVDVSFIGALYPYRVPVIDRLREEGVDVRVNPQRPDVTRTYEESRANQPGYLAYMTALARSEITLNLSRANTEDVQQLKTRLIEASIVGCLVATDDADRSDRFFEQDVHFLRFADTPQCADAVRSLLADRDALAARQDAARARAVAIAETVFWETVDRGLRDSGLAPLLAPARQAAS